MIDKVIIAEDHESANLSLQKTLEELAIRQIDYVYYCDDAVKKIRIAKDRSSPYDLLVTDLSFEQDGISQTIQTGFELIAAAREIQPEIRVLVFSAEKLDKTIANLFETYGIDAFVRKARHDAQELKKAISAVAKGERYASSGYSRQPGGSNLYTFSDLDIKIISLLSKGYRQNQIPEYFRRHNIEPASLSSIEKRLNQMRVELNFSKNEQLVLFCRDAGLLD